MTEHKKFVEHSPTAYADGLDVDQFISSGIKELWNGIPRIAGPAS